jgi:hypothetical protein
MFPTTPSLLRLPPELILEIADRLPLDAILSLRITHPFFNNALLPASRYKSSTRSKCARLALRNYLAPPNPTPSHIRCIFCKSRYPMAQFNSSRSPACMTSPRVNGQSAETVKLPHRFCAWHVGQLVNEIDDKDNAREEWRSAMRDMCMHCGAVRGWEECTCKCDSCGSRRVRTYTRYRNSDTRFTNFKLFRNLDLMGQDSNENIPGRLFVREYYDNSSK